METERKTINCGLLDTVDKKRITNDISNLYYSGRLASYWSYENKETGEFMVTYICAPGYETQHLSLEYEYDIPETFPELDIDIPLENSYIDVSENETWNTTLNTKKSRPIGL